MNKRLSFFLGSLFFLDLYESLYMWLLHDLKTTFFNNFFQKTFSNTFFVK